MRFAFALLLVVSLVALQNGIHSLSSSRFKEQSMSKAVSPIREVNFMAHISPSEYVSYIGQVGGVDTDRDGNLVIFHRANRKWEADSFIGDNMNPKYGFIEKDTVDFIDPVSLARLGSWGRNKFLMPHGLTLDYHDNLWVTDVGNHKVFKFDLRTSDEPLLTLHQFGNGDSFCKPTAIAVAERDGKVYISDGYCHHRVVVFDHQGNFLYTLEDATNPLQIAHAIALIESLNLVCTVSREQGRIVCFDTDTNAKRYDFGHPDMRTAYAIEYDVNNQCLHAVTGENHGSPAFGVTFDARADTFGKLLGKWNMKKSVVKDAHDLTVSPRSDAIYVGQLNGELDKFEIVN